MEEIDIVNYDGYYTITKNGDVYSYKNKKKRKLKQQKATQSKKGYYQVRLFSPEADKRGKLCYVHRLMWLTFKGDIPKGYEMDHIDGDTSNNTLDNLQLITRRRNVKKYMEGKYGPSLRKQRDKIIKDYKELQSYYRVAQKWGVNYQQIYRVVKDVYHKLDRTTGKTNTFRYDPSFNDEYTEKDFRYKNGKTKINR